MKTVKIKKGADWKSEFIEAIASGAVRICIEDMEVEPDSVEAFMNGYSGMRGWVVIRCYCMPEVWTDRAEALRFYRRCMYACEGSEAERYKNICRDLESGRRVCEDEDGF